MKDDRKLISIIPKEENSLYSYSANIFKIRKINFQNLYHLKHLCINIIKIK